MTNIFLFDYETRLKSWFDLRNTITNQPLETQCIEVDRYWQQVPIQNHYLHIDFIKDWPDPWTLINDNTFCPYARALGMFYTLLLLGNKSLDLIEAIDDNSNEVVLLSVDNAKYLLNYWPDTVLNNRLEDFKTSRYLDISPLYSKIG